MCHPVPRELIPHTNYSNNTCVKKNSDTETQKASPVEMNTQQASPTTEHKTPEEKAYKDFWSRMPNKLPPGLHV